MVSDAAAADRTNGLVRDVAAAVRLSEPGTANPTAEVVIGTVTEAPGARVTWLVPRVATRAAGPPRERSKVSETVPVLVTRSWSVSPGTADEGGRVVWTPRLMMLREAPADAWAVGAVVEAVVTWNGTLPGVGVVPAVSVSWTCRALPAPGATVIEDVENWATTPA